MFVWVIWVGRLATFNKQALAARGDNKIVRRSSCRQIDKSATTSFSFEATRRSSGQSRERARASTKRKGSVSFILIKPDQ